MPGLPHGTVYVTVCGEPHQSLKAGFPDATGVLYYPKAAPSLVSELLKTSLKLPDCLHCTSGPMALPDPFAPGQPLRELGGSWS